MSTEKPSVTPDQVSASGSSPVAAASLTRTSLVGIHLPRAVGCGLLGLFILDVAQLAAGYRWFDPAADFTLSGQMIERSAVPLMAFVLIFWPGAPLPRRPGKIALKFLSWSALVFTVLYLGLGVMAATGGLRVYQRASSALMAQAMGQGLLFERVAREAPRLSEGQLRTIYFELVPDAKFTGKAPAMAELPATVASLAEKRAVEVRDNGEKNRLRVRRDQMIATAKYVVGAVVIAGLFFLAWDFTAPIRAIRVVPHSHAPSLRVETSVARVFGRMQSAGESLFKGPDLEKYRWYRRLRRKLRRRS